ncbi:MAG: hydrogenase maturation protease [Verrucomicrobia bacterium]|nr:hydrogenase maturation protease [Verrucomicrobiota bacterium]
MGRVLIIGYGNPLRGDDSLGWEIARRLATSIQDKPVEVLALNQLTPELSEPISEVELVIFIDASHAGKPGSWTCETVEPNATSSHTLGHHLTPMSLLAYAQIIFKANPRALLLSVAGESFDYRQELTPSVATALPAVEQFVRETVTRAGRPCHKNLQKPN